MSAGGAGIGFDAQDPGQRGHLEDGADVGRRVADGQSAADEDGLVVEPYQYPDAGRVTERYPGEVQHERAWSRLEEGLGGLLERGNGGDVDLAANHEAGRLRIVVIDVQGQVSWHAPQDRTRRAGAHH